MEKRAFVIHGGTTFDTYEDFLQFLMAYEIDLEKLGYKDWKARLGENLKGFEVFLPQMPNKRNAKYIEWRIWFEKLIPFMSGETTLVGHSLGGLFLAKYLSENSLPAPVRALHIVAAPLDRENVEESLGDFALDDLESLKNLEAQCKEIFLYFSKDDPVVPFNNLQKFSEKLLKAEQNIFEDRGHFNQEEFPEIVRNIQNQ